MSNSAFITLSVADEVAVLPEFRTVKNLLADDGPGGRCTVLAAGAAPVPADTQRRHGGGPVPSWWQNDRMAQHRTLNVFRLREAYVLPKLGVVISTDGQVMSSSYAEAKYLYGKLGDLPSTALVDNGSVKLMLPPNLPVRDGCIITLPWGGIHNYGHFVLDCLTSVVALREAAQSGHYTYRFPFLKHWQRQHLVQLGVTPVEELADEVCFCRDVLWTSNMDHHLQGPNQSLQWLRDARPDLTAKASCRPLWLSRGDDKKRRFAANADLERRLAAIGFDVICPENLSVTEQIAAVSQAPVVAGFTGAAFANIAFCRAGAMVIEVQPSLMSGIWVRNIAAAIGCEWVPFFCQSRPASAPVIIGGQERSDIGIEIDLDPEAFVAFVADLIGAR